MGSRCQSLEGVTMKKVLVLFLVVFTLINWVSPSKLQICPAKQCKLCIESFEGDIAEFNCAQKCKACRYCTGFFAYLDMCKDHCSKGVKGCTNKCNAGKKICLNCQCT